MTFFRVIGFSVVLLLFYMGFAHMLPQVIPDTSEPVEVSTDGLDMPGMIALGDDLFSGKGTCTLCHNGMGRAPDTLEMDLAATFPERLADARYTGVAAGGEGAEAIADYIRESMLEPSVFVVAGYGKKGTNDTESPMPIVDAAPIELNTTEMNALIAFLQDRAGLSPTVPLPSADDTPADDTPAIPENMVEAPQTEAVAVLDKFFCSGCHDLEGTGADVGPGLYGLGKRMSRAEVMEAIIDPNAVIADGYEADFMPTDFGETMHVSELTLLTDYLLGLPDVAPEPVEIDYGEPPVETTLEALDKFGCAGCHDLEGSEADLGPALNGIGSRMDAAALEDAIMDPNAIIPEGYPAGIMPDDFDAWMQPPELALIVDYLLNLPE